MRRTPTDGMEEFPAAFCFSSRRIKFLLLGLPLHRRIKNKISSFSVFSSVFLLPS
jgi:hypothetical protein